MRAGVFLLLLLLGLGAACRSPDAGAADDWPDEEDEVGVGIHAWPLVEHDYSGGKERVEVLWPLYITRYDRDGTIERFALLATLINWEQHEDGRLDFGFRPFFDDSRWDGTPEDFDLDLLWPILKFKQRGDERTFGIRPLLWTSSDEDTSRFALLPLVFCGTGPVDGAHYTVVFPVYWHGSDTRTTWTHVWPLYGVDQGETYREDSVLYPFFRWARDSERQLSRWDVLWPLFHYEEDGDELTVRALPLLWHEASIDAEATVIFPFWWNIEEEDAAFRMLFPVYGHQYEGEDYERTFLGGPLYIRTRDRDETSIDLLWPLVNHTIDDDAWSFRLFPVLWLSDDAEGDGTFHVWPLFGRERWGAWTEVSTLFPFFSYRWNDQDPDAYRWHALWPLVWGPIATETTVRRGRSRSGTGSPTRRRRPGGSH